jgi:O-antigen ligase
MKWPAAFGTSRLERVVRLGLLVVLFCLPVSVVLILDQSHAEIAGRYNQFAVPVLYPLEGAIVILGGLWAWLRRPVLRPYRWLLPALAVAFLSAWWAPASLLALTAAVHLTAAFVLLVVLAREFRDEAFLGVAVWTLTAALVGQVAIGAAQYLMGHDLGLRVLGEGVLGTDQTNVAKVNGHLRAYGTLPHPNLLAAYLAVGVFWVGTVVFWPFRNRTRLRHVINTALLVTLGAGLLLTFSRMALIMVAVNGTLVVLFSVRRWKRLPLAAGIAAVGTVIVASLLLPTLMARTTVESAQETGVSNRTVGYGLAGRMIAERPFGVGAGNFVVAAPEFRDLPDYQYQPAHNALLLAAAEIGIIPALLIAVFVVRVGWQFHYLRRRDAKRTTLDFTLFALAGTFIALGMVDHFFWSLPQGLWVVSVVLAAVIARLPEKRFAAV